jgi:phosphoglucosamine mutase
VCIANKPDGLNINTQCGATNLSSLQATVLQEQADLGIAFDGDGDRVMMVDHRGTIVDGDEIIYIIAKSRQAQAPIASVVGTLMSNLGLEHAVNNLGIEFSRAQVGDRYVMEMLKEKNSVIGGENSGHVICLDRTTTGDGIIAALQVLAELHESEQSLHQVKQGMDKYPQVLVNVKMEQRIDLDNQPLIQAAQADVEQTLADQGRVLLRASGTEPLIRVMVEGSDLTQVTQLANQLADAVRQSAVQHQKAG